MFHCKWCREEIELVDGPYILLEWRHTTKLHSCRYHPETVAQPADTRWEKVWAEVEFIEDEDDSLAYYHFRVYVYYDGKRYERNHIVPKFEMMDASFDLYTRVLNATVKEIDRHMGINSLLSDEIFGALERRLKDGTATANEVQYFLQLGGTI